ncbi:MAG: hypothetical protein EKK41_22165 [Hyphomicrobiales bacterium]|nr:MAG: hypothetical protein EKK41_22165 [Hyphomicrobiales bacterium]
MNRRQFLSGGLALSIGGAGPSLAEDGIPVADMHVHLFFPGVIPGRNTPLVPLRRTMEAGGLKLLGWSLVGDLPWIRSASGRLRQSGVPDGEAALDWLKIELARVKAHLEAQDLKVALTPADIDRAIAGEPHVVLSVEGASFLDGHPENLQAAYDMGVRHVQFVHYVRNDLGDIQTEKPEHGGLTASGRETVAACNSLGILIDLAHATGKVVEDVLSVSKAPVVWSHSALATGRTPDWTRPMPFARHLGVDHAKAIADKGGVIGLWGLRSDAGPGPEGYARKLAQMAGVLGDAHVGIGTDSGALASPAVTAGADMRRVVQHLLGQGLPRESVEKIAMGNYARVLKAALTPAV